MSCHRKLVKELKPLLAITKKSLRTLPMVPQALPVSWTTIRWNLQQTSKETTLINLNCIQITRQRLTMPPPTPQRLHSKDLQVPKELFVQSFEMSRLTA